MQRRIFAAVCAVLVLGGCSIKRMAVDSVGSSLANGPSVYETDEDMQLVGDALPFSLKFIETLLAQSPDNPDLLLAACKGYTLYAYVYVQQAAEMTYEDDVARQRVASARAGRLLKRALGYGLRGIGQAH